MSACEPYRDPHPPHARQVVVGAVAVAGDGAVVALAGALSIALAAAAHGVPVIVVANVLKLRPAVSAAALGLPLALGSPADVLPADLISACGDEGLVGVSHTLDLLPPHLVHTIVTNTHVVCPAQVPWLLRETFGVAV